MKNLRIREIRQALGQLDQLVSREGEVVVTRRGQPIARVLPLHVQHPMPSHAKLRASMPRLKKGSAQHIRAERDGR